MAEPDYVIAGAGIIGLSLALELDRRGATVVVLDAGKTLAQASTAAAGMLAADDHTIRPPSTHLQNEVHHSIHLSLIAWLNSLG